MDASKTEKKAETKHISEIGALRAGTLVLAKKLGYLLYGEPLKLFRRSHLRITPVGICRMALEGLSLRAALRKNGFRRMFQLVAVPMSFDLVIGAMMFTTYMEVMRMVRDQVMWTFVAGGCAGVVQATLSCPWHNVVMEMHNATKKKKRYWGTALRHSWQNGRLFRGYRRALITEIGGLSLFFGLYHTMKAKSEKRWPDRRKVWIVLGSGATSAVIFNVSVYVLSRIHLGLRQAPKGLNVRQILVAMPVNAVGFMIYETIIHGSALHHSTRLPQE
jgi:hypothetical protein